MKYQNGVMPTNEWFSKVQQYVDFKGKTVVDIGCAEGVMAKLAKQAGASNVQAIDNQEEHFEPSDGVEFTHGKIENHLWLSGDIMILSMIIHWIGEKETLRQIENQNTLVIIFREKNHNYEIPTNGVWFPTLEELTNTLKGFKLKHHELLMVQNEDQNIILAIYVKA